MFAVPPQQPTTLTAEQYSEDLEACSDLLTRNKSYGE